MQEYEKIKNKMCDVLLNINGVTKVQDVQSNSKYRFDRVDALATIKGHALPIGFILKSDMKNDKYMYLDVRTEYKDSVELAIQKTKSVFLAYYFDKLRKVFVINIQEFILWVNSNKADFDIKSNMYGVSIQIPINKMLKEFTKIKVLPANISINDTKSTDTETNTFMDDIKQVKPYTKEDIEAKYPGINIQDPEDIPHNGPQRIVLGGQTYGNLLYALGFTYDKLNSWITMIKYDNPKTSRSKKESSIAEADIGWPSFVENFYDCMNEIMGNMLPPTEQEYVDYYLYKNRRTIKDLIIKNVTNTETKEDILENLIGRLKRTYPSIIRDISACLLLDRLGKPAFYNALVDYKLGCDCILHYPSVQYGLNMYMNTSRALSNRQRKISHFPEELIRIEWPMHDISYEEYLKDVLAIYNEKDAEQLEITIKETMYAIENS